MRKSILMSGLVAAAAIGSVPARAGASGAEEERVLTPHTKLYVPEVRAEARAQVRELRQLHQHADARRLEALIEAPRAAWLGGATREGVEESVRALTRSAAHEQRVPVLVAYNIPFRDCSQFSSGGARTAAEYLDWIDGFARGIGRRRAVVILEPDSLGIIPYHTSLDGNAEWCRPAEADPATAASERYAMLNAALDRLLIQPNVAVYLDGTHSGWLGAGDSAARLVRAGVERAHGFFLNVSNYQTSERELKYGTWISQCIAFASNPEEGGWRLGHYDYCGSQYYPAHPDDFSTWGETDELYAGMLGSAEPRTHFVIDTSRNGRGPWQPPSDAPPGDPQVWCNAPDRGAGSYPTTHTGSALADAFLWLKVPGESDGECNRWAPAGSPDPVRGIFDPPAGAWFPELALELARNAEPPLSCGQ